VLPEVKAADCARVCEAATSEACGRRDITIRANAEAIATLDTDAA
jgi:hypothetical protein